MWGTLFERLNMFKSTNDGAPQKIVGASEGTRKTAANENKNEIPTSSQRG